MDPAHFFAASPVAIVVGKGGVGKTTVSAVLACAAMRSGLHPLIIELEGKSGLSRVFQTPTFSYEETDATRTFQEIPSQHQQYDANGNPQGTLRARMLTADTALIEYLQEHGLKKLSNRLGSAGIVELIATAVPGLKDILLLGKIKQLEEQIPISTDTDTTSQPTKTSPKKDAINNGLKIPNFIIVDAPAAGHAISFLKSPQGLADAIRVGPIHSQASSVISLLRNPERCSISLVTLPEETPVNELAETAEKLQSEIGVTIKNVFINGMYPKVDSLINPVSLPKKTLAGISPQALQTVLENVRVFQQEVYKQQCKESLRLTQLISVPQYYLPWQFTSDVTATHISTMADSLLEQITDTKNHEPLVSNKSVKPLRKEKLA